MTWLHDEQGRCTEDRRRESGVEEAFGQGSNETLDETPDAAHRMFLQVHNSACMTVSTCTYPQCEGQLRAARTLPHAISHSPLVIVTHPCGDVAVTVEPVSLASCSLAGRADPTCSGWVRTRTRLRSVARSRIKRLTVTATITPTATIATYVNC